MKSLKNISPLGDLFIPGIDRIVLAGEAFEVSDELADSLIEQIETFALATNAPKTQTVQTPVEELVEVELPEEKE
jgi:hypothetical protein